MTMALASKGPVSDHWWKDAVTWLAIGGLVTQAAVMVYLWTVGKL